MSAATSVFLFDKRLEIDPAARTLRIVPLRVPGLVTAVAMFAIPAALIAITHAAAYRLTFHGWLLAGLYAVLGVAFAVVPLLPSNCHVEIDLGRKIIARAGAETALSAAAMHLDQRPRRAELFATIDGREFRILYLANGFEEIARLTLHAVAAGIRGEPDAILAQLASEGERLNRRAVLAHLAIPLIAIASGAFFLWYYLAR